MCCLTLKVIFRKLMATFKSVALINNCAVSSAAGKQMVIFYTFYLLTKLPEPA